MIILFLFPQSGSKINKKFFRISYSGSQTFTTYKSVTYSVFLSEPYNSKCGNAGKKSISGKK
jgi:hypothetical protein